jgi:hypothetical protein
MGSGEGRKGSSAARAARLEAELRANLKRRREQAKARARGAATERGGVADSEKTPQGEAGE